MSSSSMNIIPKINISNRVNISLGCSIIPVLLTHIEKESLKNYLSKYIAIPDTYNSLLKHIEDNMKNNNLHMVSLTIEIKTNINNNKNKSSNTSIFKSIKKTKKNIKIKNNSKSNSFNDEKIKINSNIHQIFIIAINNRNYNKENNYEFKGHKTKYQSH